MKPTNLQEALVLIPTHYLLNTEDSIIRAGDQSYGHSGSIDGEDDGLPDWYNIPQHRIGEKFMGYVGRRPIPQEVRELMAGEMLAYAGGNIFGYFEQWLLSQGDKT